MDREEDRRRFHRFPFRADCELAAEEDRVRACELLDLSINGALVRLERAADFTKARTGDLTLKLCGLIDGAHTDIVVDVQAVRVVEGRVACRFVRVDPDGFERLKNLVADNLGDPCLLDRELRQLDYWPGLARSSVPA